MLTPFQMRKSCLFFIMLAMSGCQSGAQQFETQPIIDHIKILAADSFEGRGTGTAGEKAAADYIISSFKKLKLQPKGDDQTFLQSFPFRHGAHGEGDSGIARNIVAYLDNGAKTTVILGAHYDHLGTGTQGGSLDRHAENKIHNGADDNASGVAGVLELARYFSANGKREKTNFLFLCFSGEELGLLGSKYFTEHPPVSLGTVNYMINLDMVGRLDGDSKLLMVYGTGTSPVWESLLQQLKTESLNIKTDSSGVGPSDHTSFYLKDLPVLHFHTGSHGDYHKPSDDWDKINPKGEAEVLKLIAAIIMKLDGQPKLAFLKTKTKAQASRAAFKVTLGIMPSYAADGEGLKVDGVTEGRPADQAGMKTGDRIIKMGEFDIKDIQAYMDALAKFEKGQTVPVKVKREQEIIDLSVTF
jgi:hypothetical protein